MTAPKPTVIIEHPRPIRADKTALDESERSFRRWMERRAAADEPEGEAASDDEPPPS